MVKDCPIHGHFEDVMAIDPAFFKHLEESFPGSDIRSHNDEKLHNHGSSTIKYGRGSVLTIDLTNRCNMMCDPCFMDANQVGFVHELSWEDIKTMLDNAITIKPKRQMSVQFSGGEPTMSPYFLDAVRYAKKVGYNSRAGGDQRHRVRQEPGVREGGVRSRPALRLPAVRRHRQRRQLAPPGRQPVRRQAARDREPLVRRRRHRPGHRRSSTASTTSRSAAIIQFALDNPKKINFLSFQPVSFTGRDEEITPERRAAQRYTLSHLAHDVKNQTGLGEPVRDWFPISFMGTFTDWADLVHGPTAEWGNLTCGCHPNCGIGMAVMIDKETKEAVPVTAFLNAEQLAKDLQQVNDAARGQFAVGGRHGAGADEELRPVQGADALQARRPDEEVRQDVRRDGKKATARLRPRRRHRTADDQQKRRGDRWNFLFIAGMWFQDLFNYDFRRTERCIIPYATQEGEISFCAYNTGIGWRNIIEKMHMTATLTKWYEEHGRHEIYAGGKKVELSTTEHNLVLDPEAVAAGKQTDLDDAGHRQERARREAARASADAEEARTRTSGWPRSTASTC